MNLAAPNPSGEHAARFFVQPTFTASLGSTDRQGDIYQGLITMGDIRGIRTLRGRVWRSAGTLRVIAEYDISELEQLNEKVLELNADYADAQFELAQANLKLQQRVAQIVALTHRSAHRSRQSPPVRSGAGNRDQPISAHRPGVERVHMADLDHFKRVNDDFGHEAGDELLVAFGEMLRRQTRATEIVARIGGEEFVVLMPHTDLADALVIAERIRTTTAAVRIASMPHGVSESFGVAELSAGEEGTALMRRIDKALYEAKYSGRNRVVAAPRAGNN